MLFEALGDWPIALFNACHRANEVHGKRNKAIPGPYTDQDLPTKECRTLSFKTCSAVVVTRLHRAKLPVLWSTNGIFQNSTAYLHVTNALSQDDLEQHAVDDTTLTQPNTYDQSQCVMRTQLPFLSMV